MMPHFTHTELAIVVVTAGVLYVGIGQRHKEENAITVNSHCLACAIRLYLHAINLELTVASLDALKPPVTNVPVADTSTILKPSTARSATTDSAGFLERAALWACRRADSCAGY